MTERIFDPTVDEVAELGGRKVRIRRKRAKPFEITGKVQSGRALGVPPRIYVERNAEDGYDTSIVPVSQIVWVEVLD